MPYHSKSENKNTNSDNKKKGTPLIQFKDKRASNTKLSNIQDTIDSSSRVTGQKATMDTISSEPIQKKENNTGLPDQLKSGIETLSGVDISDTRVHYNSPKPAQLQAHAYAQGTDIHVASGQEKHLAHEAWHVVQQKQGRVKPTTQLKGKTLINDDAGLEREADVMGAKALQINNDAQENKTFNSKSASNQTSTQLAKNENIVQRVVAKESGVSGITHIVKLSDDGSIFDGTELPIEVTESDLLIIDVSDKIRSRRGPNQELYSSLDSKGGTDYRWFRVLSINDTDYESNELYIRDDALTLKASDKGKRAADHPRERVDTIEEALVHLPQSYAPPKASDFKDAWEKATHPEIHGYRLALEGFQTAWGSCGMANEALIHRLTSLNTQPKILKRVNFVGADMASALAALLELPVTATTLIQVANPLIHEFTLEKRTDNNSFLHQGYISNFNAAWWAGLADTDIPHFTMLGPEKSKMIESREEWGKGQPINVGKIANGLKKFMLNDTFGKGALEAWKHLPFPVEKNLETKHGKLSFMTTVFQLQNEKAAVEALSKYGKTQSLTEKIMREAGAVAQNIKKFKGKEMTEKGVEANRPKLNLLGGLRAASQGGLKETGKAEWK
ncbi:DUF4157 domain-containing protein [Flavivirga abyssicola]|uniref:eCIS core domain-containing protein n=1 Tax=Flavivirga abyssicola TaxID=3063533 RepID=UPI0026E08101|nr:DUF4157 domain-containing protein [Flavivirga sp. MEBiC07777]WVK12630.1 DUF4157 domain-containing protein [Flavivirga sp. MEBiC07777]